MFSRYIRLVAVAAVVGGLIVVALAQTGEMAGPMQSAGQVRTASGTVEGFASADKKIRIFEGIPFAQPPVGELRWKPPQPAASWSGVRKTTAFSARCMQEPPAHAVNRDAAPNEDCLYLNVWTPAGSADAHLPVMVWIYGGGFVIGGASRPDGAILAHKGVVVVSMNYRLGVFGFLAHPELTKESPHHASGNYGLLDQAAALQWVRENIAAFGGDPANVTIFGESAGSVSVSAQMASPISRGLFKQAIGESGGLWSPRRRTLAQSEQTGMAFAKAVGAANLAALRAMPAKELLQAQLKETDLAFLPDTDGYFFSEDPRAIYAAGKQAHAALLAGWNSDEKQAEDFFGDLKPTKENYVANVRAEFGPDADAVLKLFPADTEQEMETSAHDLATADFISYSTWKWLTVQATTGDAPVYRYHFEEMPPLRPNEKNRGVHHGVDLIFVFGTISNQGAAVTADQLAMADMMSSYWTNFAKTGDPNGPGLPQWPRYERKTDWAGMYLQIGPSTKPHAGPLAERAQYELLDRIANERKAHQP